MDEIDTLIRQARGAGQEASASIEAVAAWRRRVANAILAADGQQESLAWAVSEVERLIRSQLPWEAAADDYAIAQRLLEVWALPPAPSAKTLMAAMALAPAHHWPAPPALASVPEWLRPLYARYLLAEPNIFLH